MLDISFGSVRWQPWYNVLKILEKNSSIGLYIFILSLYLPSQPARKLQRCQKELSSNYNYLLPGYAKTLLPGRNFLFCFFSFVYTDTIKI